MKSEFRSARQRYSHEKGVVLFIALIVLIAMSIAAIALVRSTDTANIISGNFAFKQAALQEGDVGLDVGFLALNDALSVNFIANKNADAAPRYFATMQTAATGLDPNGAPNFINAMTPADAVGAADVYAGGVGPNGNRVRYVIERMCNLVGGVPPSTAAQISANCITYTPASVSNSSRNSMRVRLNPVTTGNVYYRITVRVDGPRNTVSISQAIVRV
jgi:Tfp pilus assembly protein PilX